MAFKNDGPPQRKPPYLQTEKIFLDYSPVQALRGVSLTLNEGEIHAVVGEHGAGKTSLAYVLSGYVRPSAGKIIVGNVTTHGLSVRAARHLGIRIVAQRNRLFDNLSVADNMFLYTTDRLKHFFWDRGRREELASTFLQQTHFTLDVSKTLSQLDLSNRVLVDILRNLISAPKVLILDEALDKLRTIDRDKTMEILRDIARKGSTVVFITHRIDDVFEFADRVSIMRDGKILVSDEIQNLDAMTVIRYAYTQYSRESARLFSDKEFYQLLKYNQAVLESLPVIVLVIDTKFTIKLVNSYARSYFRLPKTLVGDLPLGVLLKHSRRTLHALIRATSSGSNQQRLSNCTLLIDRQKRIVNVVVFPIFDLGQKTGDIVIIDDVTEQEKLKQSLILSEKMTTVGLLAAGVAHEINNPLEIIFNNLSYLSSQLADQRLRSIITESENELASIAQITSNLVSFSETRRVAPEAFDVLRCIHDIAGLIRISAKKRRIQVIVSAPVDELYVIANRNEIRQVLLNLFKNSYEAMPNGGRIEIRVEERRKVKSPMKTMIRFRDTGPGIRAKDINSVFLPFFSTKKSRVGNRGLGLSMVYNIISKNKGAIFAENLPSGGCQFTIHLVSGGSDASR